MSKVNALYHIVFGTKERKMTISNDYREELYRFIWKLITEHNCRLIRIGGVADHVHILLDLHPTVALSALVRDIKAKSSGWLRQDCRFPYFEGWGKEYFAYTIGYKAKSVIIDYINSQQSHHSNMDYSTEIKLLADNAGLQINEYDL